MAKDKKPPQKPANEDGASFRKFTGMNQPDGGHTLLTEELIVKICQRVRGGAYIETAVAMSGISKGVFYQWTKKAAQQPAKYPLCVKLLDAVEQALAEGEHLDLMRVNAAAKGGNWKASAWKLERRHPHKWGRLERHEHSGPGGSGIPIRQMTDEELEAEIQRQIELREKAKKK